MNYRGCSVYDNLTDFIMNSINYKNIQFEDLGKYQIYLDDWEKTLHHDLVSQLDEKESQAWSFIRLYSIRFFVFKANSKLLHLVRDLHLGNDEESEILSRLYKKMMVDKKILLYKHKAPLHLWMRFYVREIIFEEYKRKYKAAEQSLSQSEYKIPSESKTCRSLDNEQCAFGQKCFAELWRENPMYAYVLLLRDKVGLSSRKVSELLQHVSEEYVNQLRRRAAVKIVNIARKYPEVKE